MIPSIRTARFELVSMSLAFMEALVARDFPAAEREIEATVPADMPGDLANFLGYRIPAMRADPTIQPWIGRAIVLEDASGRHVIGSVGFHEPPDDEGRVEIGYRVEPAYRRQGIATEVATALIDWAQQEHGVTRFRACTSPDNIGSRAIIANLGFVQTGSQMDEIDGLELVFDLDRVP